MGSISMGRMIGAGMVGGVAFMLMRVMGLSALMIPGGLAAFVFAIILTSPRHGIPLYRHLMVTLKARWLLSLGDGWSAQVASFLDMDADDLRLDASKVLAAPVIVEEGSLDAWEIVASSDQVAGFEVVTDTLLFEDE